MLEQTNKLLEWARLERNVQLMWLGRTCTFFAEQTAEIALIWFTWQLTKSSSQVGLIIFLVRMPFWAFGWLAGIYADRFSRQRIVISANVVGAMLAGLIPMLYVFNLLNFVLLAILAFLFSLSRAIEQPALGAQIPDIVPVERIPMMNTVLDNTKRIGRLLGPLLSSLLQIVFAVPLLYVFVAVALAIMSICSHSLKLQEPLRQFKTGSSIWEDLSAGWQVLRANRQLFLTVICFAFYNPVYAVAYWVLLPRFFSLEMGGTGSVYSLAIAFFSIGALISNLAIGVFGIRTKHRSVLLGFVFVGFGFSLLSIAPNTPSAICIVVLAAIGIPLMDIGIASLINECIPREHQGKVFALFRYFAEIGLAIGLLIGGFLADKIGSRASFAFLGAYILPLVGVFAWGIRRAS
ncbi:MFS transporter [Chitiniphilus purpureus]|uniref:MFS transporter n=1 Tax=Chitiniphilus purpureus TaxID=2981137 RepID=A0ABY6DN67_9NEIS|nr:MFS transporter [Chitiniphilus sp. CD1]UXY15799.1 MFS transporter [Chitiniphilus sp. CD1]